MLLFQWISHILTQELCQKHVKGSRLFLETLEIWQQIEFRDIVIGNESRIYLNMNLNPLWIKTREKLPHDHMQQQRHEK
jgi:hypothetical protein